MSRTDLYVRHLPGIIIFIHGVNSDGEWYEEAERGLIDGLNERLGLVHSLDGSAKLEKVDYARELQDDGSVDSTVNGKTFIQKVGRSPVIRFRWGYRAATADETLGTADEATVYAGKIYLNEQDAWGGGPFANGTTALPYMWGDGIDDRVFWWLYANMFPIEGREIYGCPPRAYFAHAAHRLKELVKAIRDKQADCPITFVCHSQGNMVGLAAAFLGAKEGALADTYVLCNPPYSLHDQSFEDAINHRSRSADTMVDGRVAAGNFGGVTSAARQRTFENFLSLIAARRGGQSLGLINTFLEFSRTDASLPAFSLNAFPGEKEALEPPKPGVDRDNRGRVFLYCNPHDQVIGSTPVQGIGWRGLSADEFKLMPGNVLYQRVWATPGGRQTTPFAVGSPDWTGRAYRYLEDNHDPEVFWDPVPPPVHFQFSFNPGQNALAKVVTTVFAAPLWLITRILNVRVNKNPPKEWAVHINAPALRVPITAQSYRLKVYGRFDEKKDPARDRLATRSPPESGSGTDGGALDDPWSAGGKGDVKTEAALRAEIAARVRASRARGEIKNESDQREALKRMINESPNATDHSTILTNAQHAEGVLAYDVAVGWLNPEKITDDYLLALRQMAHWRMVEAASSLLAVADRFVEYKEQGFYNQHPVQFFYDTKHMSENASGIADERERSALGYGRG